jgi:hypothetical protein
MGNCCEIEKKEPEIEINKINFDDTPILIYEKEETPKSDKNIFNIDNNLETNEKEETSTSNNLKSKKEKIKEKNNENIENKKEIPNKNLLINSSNLIEKLHIIDFQIFNIINEMRMNPKKFLKDSFKHKLNQIFENIISNQNKNLKNLNFPKNHLHEINIYLKDMKNIDKNLKAKENDIIKILGNKIDKKNYFQSISSKEEAKENVWNLLENFDDEDYVILTEPFDNLIVISVPLDGTNKIITSYIFFNQTN